MQMNPHEIGASERIPKGDPELVARVLAIETVLPTLATRAQLEQLRGEMKEGFGAARTELKEEIGALRSEVKEDLGTLRAEMKEEIGALRGEMKDGFGALRGEMHAAVLSSTRWGLAFAVSAAMMMATFISTAAPYLTAHLRG